MKHGDMENEDDILVNAKELFDKIADYESDNRESAIDDIRFSRLSEQWPKEIRDQREREGRPCLTINRLPAFIRQVVNDSRQNKPSIVTHPVDSNADPETAEIINGLIRNIEYISNADTAYDISLESAVTNGFGYFRIGIEYSHDDSFDMDIMIEQIPNPLSVYGDPDSTRSDSSDWNVAFVVDSIHIDEFKKNRGKYKGAEEVDWSYDGYRGLESPWFEEDHIQIAEYWTREEVEKTIYLLDDGTVIDDETYNNSKDIMEIFGRTIVSERITKSYVVTQRIMTGAEILETNKWPGKYIPIVPVYGDEVNLEGKRHFKSMISDAKDSQRMFNYWRTTSTELVALAPKTPFIGPKGSFKSDIQKWNSANTQTHAFIEFDGGLAPQRQPFAGPPAGALQEALNAADDLKSIMGIYDASLGARSNETSGIAIRARQREGDVSTFHFIDNLNRSIRHAGRILLDLIPKIYTGDRIIRILGEDGDNPENVQLGQQQQSQLPEGVDRVYDLSIGKYDLTVKTGPNFTSKREEAASQMIELLRAFPQAAPVIGDLLAKNLDWPGADEIAKRLKSLLPPGIEDDENPQMQAMQQQFKEAMEQAKQQLEQANNQIEIFKKDRAEAAGKLEIEKFNAETARMKLEEIKADKLGMAGKLEIEKYNAETDRIKATQSGMTAEQIQQLIIQTLQQINGGNIPNVGQLTQTGGV